MTSVTDMFAGTSPETWRQIPGTGGWYEASDQGRIRSWRAKGTRYVKRSSEPHVMSPSIKNRLGHRMVLLRVPGRPGRVSTLVHRAVLAAFVGPCPLGHVGRHLDGDPSNNSLSNLAYGTPGDNERDKVRHGTHRNASKTHCPRNHPYDEQNTIFDGVRRRCRECIRIRNRKAAEHA